MQEEESLFKMGVKRRSGKHGSLRNRLLAERGGEVEEGTKGLSLASGQHQLAGEQAR